MPDKHKWLRRWVKNGEAPNGVCDLLTERDQLAQAIRECIEQTDVGAGSGEDLPDALRQIAQVVLLQRGNLELLAKENADYREGFDSDGCTAAESCCGEIKGALADKIERLEKELAEQKDEVKRIFGYSEDEMCLARFRRRTEHPSAEPEVKP